jgi:hypothetical protein
MKKKHKLLLNYCIVCILLASCRTGEIVQKNQNIIVMPTKTAQVGIKPSETSTEKSTNRKTVTPTQSATSRHQLTATLTLLLTPSPSSSWITLTPQSPEPEPTAKAMVEELLRTNSGCKLPCWWGIEPGTTEYTSAIKDLSPLAASIAIKEIDSVGSLIVDLLFPVPETIYPGFLGQRYRVDNSIIQQLEVMPGNVESYTFNRLLQDYGKPEEVWLDGLIDPSSDNPFSIFFYYPEKGIIASFGFNAVDLGNVLRLCPDSTPANQLILWKPVVKESFINFVGKTHILAYLRDEKMLLIPLEEATDDNLQEIEKHNCFETPKNIWPIR